MAPSATPPIETIAVPDAFLFGVGVGLLVLGMYLRWKFSHHWMQTEERAKDGWLSEEQARRRIAFMRYTGPLSILLGVAVFVVLFWR